MLDEGDWKFDHEWGEYLFHLIDVAHEWGLLPSTLGVCEPESDHALMVAYIRNKALRAAWENQIAERERKKPRK